MKRLCLVICVVSLSPLIRAQPPTDADIARQFLSCSILDAHFQQISTDQQIKKEAEVSGASSVVKARGLTDNAFTDREMPKVFDQYRAGWVAASNANNLESFLRQKAASCLQLEKEHGYRALDAFHKRALRNRKVP